MTETVTLMTGQGPGLRLQLNGDSLSYGFNDDSETFTGAIELNSGVEVMIERVSIGPVQIECEAFEGGSVGTLIDEHEHVVKELGSEVTIEIRDPSARAREGDSVVIPVSGRVEIGREINYASGSGHAMLRSGDVTLLGRSILGSTRYEAGRVQLDPADRFHVESPEDAAFGVVVADERPALSVIYRVVGKRGVVTRFGARGYDVTASIRARLINDNAVQGLWVTFLAVMAFGCRLVRGREEK